MKRIVMICACLVILTALTGCNTVRGMGKDIERAGGKIQEVAD